MAYVILTGSRGGGKTAAMTMNDHTRRELVKLLNMYPQERPALEEDWGQVWDTQQLSNDFEVLGYMAPYVVVIRKSDNKRGSLMFQHQPRYYFAFEEEK